ncbi:MAG: biotin/lipoyl-binding protein, partial [Rhodoferax sp.]|nr:biotin/lipoyl-binding protein [Rhodoferax sp.]
MSLQPITSAALVVLACLVTAGPARAVDGEYQCLIEPYRRIEIRSAVEALIDKVHVQRGSVVRKGQRLVELQSDVERAALDSAKFRAVMEGSMRSAEARVDYARDKLRRREELSRQNFVSSQERDDAAAEMRVAQAELLEARDNRQLAVLESKRLEELLRQRTLISPFDGVV